MGRNNVPGMYKTVERTSALCQVRVVGIIGSNSIENEIQTIRKVGHTSAKAVEIKAIFDIRAFDFAKHFMSLETTKPSYSRESVEREKAKEEAGMRL